MNNKQWTIFSLILVLVIFCLLVDLPRVPSWIPGHNWFSNLKVHLGLDLQGGLHLIYKANTDKVPQEDIEYAVEGVRDVIERRINAFGVAEPQVQTAKTGNEWRIIVELPGISNVSQALEMIGQTPILEFKEQGQARSLTSEEQAEIDQYNQEQLEKARSVLERIKKGESFEDLAKEYSEDVGSKEKGGDLGWFGKGVMVPEFEKAVFEDLKKGEITPEPVETQFGYHIIKKVDERTNQQGETEVRASHILFLKESKDIQVPEWTYTGLTGQHLKRAYLSFDQQNAPQVSLEFDEEGAKLFKEITQRNINKPVAIFLDGTPISIPTVQEVIPNGRAVITGKFSIIEAKELAERLSAGALPVPIELLSQQKIGPSLGKVYLERSFFAGLLGLLLVMAFLIYFYRRKGSAACLALMVYALIVLAIYKLIPVTLTLAGVAGFILSIGMAVDANVLIFERIKEEQALGKEPLIALKAGFQHAWTAIRDSNITSLIICFILYQFGTGLVRGFGLTLGIGILVSMFSAMVVTRLFLEMGLKRFFPSK